MKLPKDPNERTTLRTTAINVGNCCVGIISLTSFWRFAFLTFCFGIIIDSQEVPKKSIG